MPGGAGDYIGDAGSVDLLLDLVIAQTSLSPFFNVPQSLVYFVDIPHPRKTSL